MLTTDKANLAHNINHIHITIFHIYINKNPCIMNIKYDRLFFIRWVTCIDNTPEFILTKVICLSVSDITIIMIYVYLMS